MELAAADHWAVEHVCHRATQRLGPVDEATAAALRARQPLGRLVTAEEVAQAVASLASPLAASTTGAILRVDGGMTSLRV